MNRLMYEVNRRVAGWDKEDGQQLEGFPAQVFSCV